jgi:hypothetical protein
MAAPQTLAAGFQESVTRFMLRLASEDLRNASYRLSCSSVSSFRMLLPIMQSAASRQLWCDRLWLWRHVLRRCRTSTQQIARVADAWRPGKTVAVPDALLHVVAVLFCGRHVSAVLPAVVLCCTCPVASPISSRNEDEHASCVSGHLSSHMHAVLRTHGREARSQLQGVAAVAARHVCFDYVSTFANRYVGTNRAMAIGTLARRSSGHSSLHSIPRWLLQGTAIRWRTCCYQKKRDCMTEMQAQDKRARRRRARWGPEAGEESHDSVAAQPLQATPTPPAIAGKACYA